MTQHLPVLESVAPSDAASGPAAAILGVGTAVPALGVSQADVLKFILERFPIQNATKILYRRTLSNPAVKRRHFALDRLEDVLETDLGRINRRFERAATELSAVSVSRALANAGVSPDDVDFLVTATCTGYLCPGLSSFLIERCGLRSDVRVADLAGMGCGAAVPALEQAANFISSHPNATAVVVCTEICSAAMFSSDDVDIIISNTIFSDGSASVVLRSSSNAAGSANSSTFPVLRGFASETSPEWRETLRFKNERGFLKNVLGKDVPEQAGQAVRDVVRQLLHPARQTTADVDRWLVHAGGRTVIDAIAAALGLPESACVSSRAVLRDFGNMSSPTVLFVLEAESRRRAPRAGERAILTSFGAGFTAHAALLEYR